MTARIRPALRGFPVAAIRPQTIRRKIRLDLTQNPNQHFFMADFIVEEIKTITTRFRITGAADSTAAVIATGGAKPDAEPVTKSTFSTQPIPPAPASKNTTPTKQGVASTQPAA